MARNYHGIPDMDELYLALIKNCDRQLSQLRAEWVAAENSERAKWMALINEALDGRLILMRWRDTNRLRNLFQNFHATVA